MKPEDFTPPQPTPPEPPKMPGERKNPNKILLVIAILVFILALGFTIALFLKKQGIDTGSRGDDDGVSFASMIPIWVAVFVPIMASKKKQQKKLSDKQKRAMYIIIALTGLLVLATAFLWGYNN
jgi:flagellar basal body-associated protein FliL